MEIGIKIMIILSEVTWSGEKPEDDSAEKKKKRDCVDCILSRSETRAFSLGNAREGIVCGKVHVTIDDGGSEI